MRVALATIYDVAASGGLSTYVESLAKALRARGADCRVVTPNTLRGVKALLARAGMLAAKAAYVVSKPLGVRAYYRAAAAAVAAQLGADGEIVHVQDQVCLRYLELWGKTEPGRCVLTLHGDLANMARSDGFVRPGSPEDAFVEAVERAAYRAAGAVIAVDERLGRHAASMGADAGKITRMPNFCDTTRFTPAKSGEKEAIRLRLGLPENVKIIFCPRRLVPKNGVVWAVETVAKLGAGHLLVITGEGPEKAAVEKRMKELRAEGLVRMTGDIPNRFMPDWYRSADLCVIPSVTSHGVIEATSISAIESLACGVPVLGSNIGGIREVVRDGEEGFLRPEADPKAFAQAASVLFSLAPDDASRLSAKCAARAKERFSESSYATTVLGIYENLA